MSDHRQCISTPAPTPIPTCPPAAAPPCAAPPASGSWEDQPVFRWLFLAHVPPEMVEHFAAFGEVIYDGILEGKRMQHEPSAHLRGLAADLDSAALFLDSYTEVNGLEMPGLANPISGWRYRLQALAEEIRAAVGREVAPDEN